MNAAKAEAKGAFGFQTGQWRVRHRKLKARLAGATEWLSFEGRCTAWEIMDGAANVEDQVLDDPAGAYRAAAFRRLDPETGNWSIWWFDARFSSVDPPVRGRFENGVGTFLADDTLNGRPIKVRFLWSQVDTPAPRWEQAFSDDGGKTWETNWIMEFERA